jgi:hypothetical protein
MGTRRRTAATLAGGAAGLALLAVATACSSSGTGTTSAGGSCAALVTYGGREYQGLGTAYRVPVGRALGQANEPPCYDNMVDGTPHGSPGRAVPVRAVRGVDPRWAIADPANDFSVYIVRDRPAGELPAALRRVVRPPACTGSTPMTLAGELLGVTVNQPRGDRPVAVELIVDRTSPGAARYRDADMTVRITTGTAGSASLRQWHGGDARVEVVARCDGTAFVADQVTFRQG